MTQKMTTTDDDMLTKAEFNESQAKYEEWKAEMEHRVSHLENSNKDILNLVRSVARLESLYRTGVEFQENIAEAIRIMTDKLTELHGMVSKLQTVEEKEK